MYNSSVVVPAGTALFVSVRAFDVAGRYAEARSDGVLMLQPPPLRSTTTSTAINATVTAAGNGTSTATQPQGSRGSFVCYGSPTLFKSNATLTPVVYLYQLGFQQDAFGQASAVAWILFILIFSLTLVPLLAYWMLRKGIPHGDNGVVSWAKRVYEPVLLWALDKPRKVVAIALSGFALSVVAIRMAGPPDELVVAVGTGYRCTSTH